MPERRRRRVLRLLRRLPPFLVNLDPLYPSQAPYAPCETRPVRRRLCLSFRRRLCPSFRQILVRRRRRCRTLRLIAAWHRSRRPPALRSRQRCRLDRLFGVRSPRHLPVRTRVASRSRPDHRHRHNGGLYRRRSRRLCCPDETGRRSRVGRPANEEQFSRRLSRLLRRRNTALAIPAARQPLQHRLRPVHLTHGHILAFRPRRNLSRPLSPVLLCRTRTSSRCLVRLVAPPVTRLPLLQPRQTRLR